METRGRPKEDLPRETKVSVISSCTLRNNDKSGACFFSSLCNDLLMVCHLGSNPLIWYGKRINGHAPTGANTGRPASEDKLAVDDIYLLARN